MAGPRFRRSRLVPVVAALFLLAGGCGEDDPRGDLHHLRGRVEAPAGVDLTGAGVYVVRSGNSSAGGGTEERAPNRLEFDLKVYGEEPVDVVVATLPRIAFPGESLDATLERARARSQTSRQILTVGSHAGALENVRPGSDGLVIRMEPIVMSSLTVRSLDLDGLPAGDLEVRLTSRADWISGRTGDDGRVTFDEVPVRTWRIEVKPPPKAWPNAVAGRATVVPAAQVIDVPLRRSVIVRARLSGTNEPGLFVAYGDAHQKAFWLVAGAFDDDGVLPLAADPDWKDVRVRLERMGPKYASGWDSESLVDTTVPVREGATAELTWSK